VTEPQDRPINQQYRWITLAGVWLLYAAFGLGITSLAPLIENIRADLDISYTAMGLILGIWQFVYIGSAIPCGMLLDKIGSRYALLIGALFVAISLLGRAFANDFYSMLVAVMIFTGSSRGMAMGIYMTGPAIGGIISLTLTHSVLLPSLDNNWRNIMFLWAAVSGGVALAWFFISGHRDAFQAGLSGVRSSSSQLQVFRLIAKEPTVAIVLAMSIGVFLVSHGLSNWLPEILHTGGMSYTQAGYWAAIPTVIGIAGSLLIPRLATPERRFNILIGLCLCAAASSFLLQFSDGPALFAGLFLQGLTRAALMTILILILVELPSIGERYAGVASGFFFSAAQVGGVLGPLTMGLFFDRYAGFTQSLYFLTFVALVTGVGAVGLKRSVKPVAADG
jgi:CP family cyanate transporter-like MFS transporter